MTALYMSVYLSDKEKRCIGTFKKFGRISSRLELFNSVACIERACWQLFSYRSNSDRIEIAKWVVKNLPNILTDDGVAATIAAQTGKYNYKWQKPSSMSYTMTLISLVCTVTGKDEHVIVGEIMSRGCSLIEDICKGYYGLKVSF